MSKVSTHRISNDYATQITSASSYGSAKTRKRIMRIGLLSMIAVMWSGILVFRLASLQLFASDFWRNWGIRQHFSEVKVAAERGAIYDRNGQLMAVSVPAGSVYVRPREVIDKGLTVDEVASTLEMDPTQVRKAVESKAPFAWIKRQLPRVIAEKVAALKLPGVGQILESRRFYPYNQAASALIGRVGVDGNGLSGLEARYDKTLSKEVVKIKVTRDALGNMIQELGDEEEHFELPKGSDLHLTIDAAIQSILDEELERGRQNFNAKAALGAMVNTETGEILALGQAPSFNFNEDKVSGGQALINMAIETVFEPGSIMKPIVTAAALQQGVVTPTDTIDCELGRFRYGGHIIKDTHNVGLVTVRDVVIHSSNIGMTKIAIKLGRDHLYDFLDRFGFGHPIGLNLPGETGGILRNKKGWSTVDVATHSFGQGVAVTPLQMLRALSSVVNGGILPKLKIVADGKVEGERVISEETAASVRDMMFGVVEDPHGTGKRAAIKGIRIGGKTGTAQKARKGGRGYASGQYMASFMGFADASSININDKLALIVVVDEPHKGSIYGGTVAAPIFKNTMIRVLHVLSTRSRLNGVQDRLDQLPQMEHSNPEAGVVQAAYNFRRN